ncbi:MAG: NUDIX domain-containing protein [Ktedonobacteraceae bacterium]|nr:NUDIX domain-containing protein [Ktedonobacteraceae bacterium]
MPVRPSVGVGVLVTRGHDILLMKRHNAHGAGTWSPPGGHLEHGESFQECAIRETLEETGVLITDATVLAVTNDIFEAEGKHYVTVWVEGKYLSGEAEVISEREASAVSWFPWHALPEPLFLPFQNLLAIGYRPAKEDFRERDAYA